jgi:hypothetical protein
MKVPGEEHGMTALTGDDDAGIFPLRVAPNRRYLIDSRGAPCLVHGDAAWSLITALTREEMELYLADRASKGFNSIMVNLIEHKFNGPFNRYGEPPFTVPGRLSTPNEAYFAHADRVIRRAGEYGIQLFLAPLYLGYIGTDEGWIEEVLAAGVDGCREWGRYVGRRYAAFDNIIWTIGADREPSEVLDHVDATVEGIREFDRRHLFTAGSAPERSPAQDFGRGGWLDLNATYTYGIVHRKLLADYTRRPVRPFILAESTYEGEHNASPAQIRRQAYWALLCGACGQFFGNLPLWAFYGPGDDMAGTQIADNEAPNESSARGTGWQKALDGVGSRDMVHVRALFLSRPWYRLVPDERRQVVTGGLGEFRGLDYLAAARTTDGGTAIAYMPTARTISVDLTRLCAKTVQAWWFDPRTGAAQPAGNFAASDCREFTPPADGDWVLVLDDISRNLPAPGTMM